MSTCIQLDSIDELQSQVFLDRLTELKLINHWKSFKKSFSCKCEASQAGQVFCHLFAINLVIGDTIYLSKVPKLNGYIARLTDIKATLTELNLFDHWEQVSMGSTYCLIDDSTRNKFSNTAIFWQDIEKFCRLENLTLKAICPIDLPDSLSYNTLKNSSSLTENRLVTELSEQICGLIDHEINILKAHSNLRSHYNLQRVLFVCTANIQRSLTAELYFRPIFPSIEFKSAGVSRRLCLLNNTTLCSEKLLAWSDVVFVFEEMHYCEIKKNTNGKMLYKIVNLGIADLYKYKYPSLVKVLHQKVIPFLKEFL